MSLVLAGFVQPGQSQEREKVWGGGRPPPTRGTAGMVVWGRGKQRGGSLVCARGAERSRIRPHGG